MAYPSCVNELINDIIVLFKDQNLEFQKIIEIKRIFDLAQARHKNEIEEAYNEGLLNTYHNGEDYFNKKFK